MDTILRSEQVNITGVQNGLVNVNLVNGIKLENITPKKLFPITRPNNYIVFSDEKEDNNKYILNDTINLDPASKETLENALSRRYIIPVIEIIENVNEKNGLFTWDVATDRGQRKLEIRNIAVNVKSFNDRVIIRDIDENKYEIVSKTSLDTKSYKNLQKTII